MKPKRPPVTVIDTIKARSNQYCVEYLERMLDEARRGELVELVAVTKYSSGDYNSVWTPYDNGVEIAGMVARMQHLLQNEMDVSEE